VPSYHPTTLDHLKSYKEGPMSYRISVPPTIRAHNVLHMYLLKKYIHDYNHNIDWTVIQVELEGEFDPDPQNILDMKEILL
jgi:hypothetical protein